MGKNKIQINLRRDRKWKETKQKINRKYKITLLCWLWSYRLWAPNLPFYKLLCDAKSGGLQTAFLLWIILKLFQFDTQCLLLTSLLLAPGNAGNFCFSFRFSLQMVLWAVVLIQVLYILLLKWQQALIMEIWWTQFLSKKQK